MYSLGVVCALELYVALEDNTRTPVLRVGSVRRYGRPAFAFIMVSGEDALTCSDHTGSPLSHPGLPCEVWVDGKAGTPGHTIPHPSTPGYFSEWIRRQLPLRVVGSAV